jgi:hypothetical protein
MLGSAIDGVMAVHRCTSASLEMPYTNVKSALYLVQSKFSEKIDFVAAAFGELIFDLQLRRADEGFIFPRTLLLREATYRGLRAKWLSLIQCLELQRDPDWSSFREIEAYFRRGGHDDWADEVRYRGRKAVTKRFRFGSERLGQSLVGLVSGFGAKPGRLLKSAMIVFALLTAEMSVMGDVNCNPKALTQPGCSIQTLVSSSFDFVIRGDGSRFAESTKSPPRIYSAHEQLGYDAAVVLRLLLLLLSGLWVGYFTGLIRYAGGQR